MRTNRYLKFVLAMLALFPPCYGSAVIDRIALVVDKKIFTETEVMDELRITQFLNGEPLDLGPEARRAAAERLVDQELIRREMELTAFAQSSAADADAALRSFREQRFPSDAPYRAALQKYSITEGSLKQHLQWQLTAIRFTDYRFRSDLPAAATQSADRAEEATGGVDEQMDSWLKQARSNVKIVFRPEAFQ